MDLTLWAILILLISCLIFNFSSANNQLSLLEKCISLFKIAKIRSKNIFLPIILLLSTINALGQKAVDFKAKMACTIDGTPVLEETIRSQLINLSRTDQLNVYFKQVKDTLIKDNQNADRMDKEFYSNYIIKNITQSPTSCAICDYDHGSNLEKVIAINVDYYYPKVIPQYQKAMFIWIIGHELKHHQRDDSVDENELKNITKELACDEAGGYLIARLTNNINLQDIEIILNKILTDNPASQYAPPLKYRILAVQAGWIRGKARYLSNHQQINFDNITIEKEGDGRTSDLTLTAIKSGEDIGLVNRITTTGSLYWGLGDCMGTLNGEGINLNAGDAHESYNNVFFGNYTNGIRNGFFKVIWENEKYIGQYLNNAKNGYGTDIWYEGNQNGQKYQGNFVDDNRNGFGIYSITNANGKNIFIGEWKNGLKNGHGVEYSGYTVIHSGLWKNDAYISDDNDY